LVVATVAQEHPAVQEGWEHLENHPLSVQRCLFLHAIHVQLANRVSMVFLVRVETLVEVDRQDSVVELVIMDVRDLRDLLVNQGHLVAQEPEDNRVNLPVVLQIRLVSLDCQEIEV
jgi:hypothetical protein